MKRREVREITMQMLYQMEITQDFSEEVLERSIGELSLNEQNKKYVKNVYSNLNTNKTVVDEKISAHLKEWTIDRISKVDLSILRLAIVEILYLEDIPNSVAINEAVEVAKKFSDEDSAKYINAVLGKIA